LAAGTSANCAHAALPAHSKTPSTKAAFAPQILTPQLSRPRTAPQPDKLYAGRTPAFKAIGICLGGA
jgi:hypothetical protein